jgi:hypothetical protein
MSTGNTRATGVSAEIMATIVITDAKSDGWKKNNAEHSQQ